MQWSLVLTGSPAEPRVAFLSPRAGRGWGRGQMASQKALRWCAPGVSIGDLALWGCNTTPHPRDSHTHEMARLEQPSQHGCLPSAISGKDEVRSPRELGEKCKLLACAFTQ